MRLTVPKMSNDIPQPCVFAVKGTWEMLDRLMEELERLEERYADEPIAIEALEAVKYWAVEESGPAVRLTVPKMSNDIPQPCVFAVKSCAPAYTLRQNYFDGPILAALTGAAPCSFVGAGPPHPTPPLPPLPSNNTLFFVQYLKTKWRNAVRAGQLPDDKAFMRQVIIHTPNRFQRNRNRLIKPIC